VIKRHDFMLSYFNIKVVYDLLKMWNAYFSDVIVLCKKLINLFIINDLILYVHDNIKVNCWFLTYLDIRNNLGMFWIIVSW
jgi:hypothetical protein